MTALVTQERKQLSSDSVIRTETVPAATTAATVFREFESD